MAKSIKKANKNAAKGGKKMWKKGQSSSFNPKFNKHRLEAKKRAMIGVRGEGNLTEAKLAIHNRLTTDSQCDENEEEMSVGGETAMTAFTNCSLPTFNRLLKNWNSNSFLHKEMLAIIAAVTDVLKTKEGKETETEYFAALMTTLDIVQTDESLTAVICLLSMLAKRLNESVLKLHFKTVCKAVMQILLNPKYLKSDHCALLRNSLLILHTFLKGNGAWAVRSEEEEGDSEAGVNYKSVLRCVLEYVVHHKPKVRKVAHEIIYSILAENVGESRPGAKLVAEYCIDFLETQGGPAATKEIFYVLALLQDIFGLLPKPKIKAACETIFKVMTLSNAVLSSSCLKTLLCLFSMKPKPEQLPADMNAQIINVLYNYEPNINESQPLSCWLEVMESSFINLKSLDERLCLLHMPAFTSRAVKCWLSGRQEVLPIVEFTLKRLVSSCIDTDSPVFQQLLLEDPVANPVHKMFQSVEAALSYEYHKAWKHVLNVLATFFEVVGKCSYTVMMKCLRSLGDMHDGYNFPCLAELEQAVGVAVQRMGPAIVIKAIPLHINCESAQPNFPRSWMLPLLRDNIKKTELKFFIEYFLPLAGRLRNKVTQLQQEQRMVESKLYDTVCSQIWSLLPGFCNEPTDLKESFCKVAQLLGEVLKKEPTLRPTVLSSLRQLISKNLENGENREELAKYAKNYLPILFNLYTTETKDSAEEKVRLTVYEAIRAYLQLASEDLCKTFFTTALSKLSSTESGTFMQHALLDVCKAMLPYLDASRVGELYQLCKPLLEHKNRTTQKKSFGVMNEICSCRTEVCLSFVREHFEELKPVLCGTAKGLTPATKALRLNSLQCIVNHLTKEDMETIVLISAEAVICTKENSVKARTAAFNLLVAIGHTLKRIMPEDAKVALQEYMKILLAGLAGESTHLIGATILAIGRVMYEFKSDIDGKLIDLLVENVCILIKSRSREVVVAALSFLKILFAVLDTTDLLYHVQHIVESVTQISEENQRQLRFKAKELFTRLVRKFGYEMIFKMVPDSHKKQLSNIRKLESRKHKEKGDEEEDIVRESRKKADTFEDILADSDDESLEDEEIVKKKKMKRPKRSNDPMLEEHGENDIVDFMDPAVNKRLLTKRLHKPSEVKKTSDAFPVSEDGRLIIREEDEKSKKEKKKEELLPLKELGLANKKRKRKQEDSDEEDEELKGVAKGIHRLENKNKRRLPGEEFKATKAGGDIKKGKVDPYAYVPFNRQALNKRKNVKLKGQYKNIVKAAKHGANIGVKRKMREAKKRKNRRR